MIEYDANGKASGLYLQKNTISFELIPNFGSMAVFNQVSAAEIEWLAYEISNWLKVPIKARLRCEEISNYDY
jgi:hypothetical protein